MPQGELAERAQIDLELPDPPSPAALKIAATLSLGEKQYHNNWSARLYPAQIRPAESAVAVFVSDPGQKDFLGWSVKPIPAEGKLASRAVYVTDDLFDARIVDAMNRGASAVLLSSESTFWLSYPVTFRTTWWKAGDAPDRNHCGTFVYDHPATQAMAPDGWCDAGWFDLLKGAGKCSLEKMPARPGGDRSRPAEHGTGRGQRDIVPGWSGPGVSYGQRLESSTRRGRPENQWLLSNA